MTCLEALELLHDELDAGRGRDAPGAARRAGLEGHLASCAECAKAARQLRELRTALRSMPAVHAPEGFHGRVMTSLGGGGRMLAFRRLLVPLAAAAAVVAALVVVERTRDMSETAVGSAAPPAASKAMRTGDAAESGLTAQDAVEAARRDRKSRERNAADAPEDDHDTLTSADESSAKEKAAGRRGPPKAPAPVTKPAAPEAKPPAASESPPDTRAPDDPPSPGDTQAVEEETRRTAGEKHDEAKSDPAAKADDALDRTAVTEQSVPASKTVSALPVHVVVFHDEAEARAFLAAIQPKADLRRSEPGVDHKDGAAPVPESTPEAEPDGDGVTGRTPPSGGAGGGGGGGGAEPGSGSGGGAGSGDTGGGPTTGGGGTGGGGRGKSDGYGAEGRDRKGGAPVTRGPGALAAETGIALRVLGRVAVTTDAWRTQARRRKGAIVDDVDTAAAGRAEADPDAFRVALTARRFAALADRETIPAGAGGGGDSSTGAEGGTALGVGGTSKKKEAGKAPAPSGVPPPQGGLAPAPADAARAAARGATVLVVVEDILSPPKPGAPLPAPPADPSRK